MAAAVRSLCFSSAARPIPPQPPPLLSARAPTLPACPLPSSHSSSPSLVVLPELPMETKEKILSLELLGIDSTKALSLNSSLLSTPLPAIHDLISFLLSKGIHHKDLRRIFGMCPSLLTADVRTSLAPVFRFLSDDLGVPEDELRRPINKCPRLLASSVRDQLKPALIYLTRLGIRDHGLLAFREPVLLVSSVERTLMPKLEFIVSVGFTREEAAEMVRRCPGLFTFSIEKNFRPKLRYFTEEMGGGLAELRQFPQFFAFSLTERIMPRHRRAVDAGVKLPLPLMLKARDEEFDCLLSEQQHPPGKMMVDSWRRSSTE